MANYRWVILHIVLVFALVGCVSKESQPVIQPSPTNTSFAVWCKDFDPINGFLVDSKLKNSHILYKAFPLENKGNGTDQTWVFSLKDNTNKLSSDIFPYPDSEGGQYDVNGFSLNSADERHIAIWGHWYEESNADGTYSLIIKDKESGEIVDVFRTGPAENIQGGWSPDGNHFVFTSYKNSDQDNPQFYSLVYAVNADGTGLRKLTDKLYLETLERPRWSPDSNKIAIPIWGKDGGMHMMVINFLAGKVSRYKVSPIIRLSSTNYGGWVEQGEMAWSPDSQYFAYISQYEHNGIEILNVENGKIYCVENEKISGVDKVLWVYDNP